MHISLFVSNTDGGLLHYCSQLANALAKRIKVSVIAPEGVRNEYFSPAVEIVQVPFNKISTWLGVSILSPKRLYNIINEINADILHITSPDISLATILPLLDMPTISTIHDPITPSAAHITDNLQILTDDIARRMYYRYSKHFFVHGEEMSRILKNRGISEQTVTSINHGHYGFFKEYLSEGQQTEPYTILFFGFISPHKGVSTLLKSENKIFAEVPDADIVIAGKGNFSQYDNLITDSQRYNIINRFVTNEEVAKLFSRATVVVLPYNEATQSGVVPIAYPFGNPVVATDVGSIPEVIDEGETGLVVPPKDEEELADAIVKILKDPALREKMSNNARAKAQQDLSWEAISRKTIDAYQTVLN